MQYAGNLGGGGSAATLAILEKLEKLEQENHQIKQSLGNFLNGTNIASASHDLNTLKSFGAYYANQQTKNTPPNSSGGCVVLVFGLKNERIAQLSTNGGTICIRYFNGTTWSSWTTK